MNSKVKFWMWFLFFVALVILGVAVGLSWLEAR